MEGWQMLREVRTRGWGYRSSKLALEILGSKYHLVPQQGMETAFVHEVPKAGSKQHPAPHQQPWKWEYRNNAAPSSSPSARKHRNTKTMQTLQHPLHAFFDSRSNHRPSVRLSWKIVSHSPIHKLRNTVRSDSSSLGKLMKGPLHHFERVNPNRECPRSTKQIT